MATAIAEGAESLGMSADTAIALLGDTCFDVYLNDVAYWRCVPAGVWRYTIGGYRVVKKWLSYRERALLGRDLRPEEARCVTEMVRRIAWCSVRGSRDADDRDCVVRSLLCQFGRANEQSSRAP